MDNVEKTKRAKFNWWMLTWNNPDVDWVGNLKSLKADYSCGQLEKGEQGTLHIQAVVYTRTDYSPAHWKGFPIWIKGLRRADVQASLSYVQKADTRVEGPIEIGDRPKLAGKSRDYDGALKLAKEGKFLQCEANVLIPHLPNLQKLSLLYAKPREPEGLRGYWWYGKPGTGKSRAAFDSWPAAFRKS